MIACLTNNIIWLSREETTVKYWLEIDSVWRKVLKLFFPQSKSPLYLPISTVRILKSMPMVVINAGLNEFSTNRNIIHVLPTPLSPIRSNLNKKSNFFSILNRGKLQQDVSQSVGLDLSELSCYLVDSTFWNLWSNCSRVTFKAIVFIGLSPVATYSTQIVAEGSSWVIDLANN